MVRTFTLFFLLFLVNSRLSVAQNYYADLTVHDPQRGFWTSEQGSVDEAIAVVRPKGLFTEIELFLTFSAAGYYYSNQDTLEVVLDFQLPTEAMITDSWLWVGEDIVRGRIADRWSASRIYEDIVDRRQDPSILFKQGNGSYQLRIFPLSGQGSRKVKLSLLVPVQWGEDAVQMHLPTHLVKASSNAVDLKLIVQPGDEWGVPQLTEQPGTSFQTNVQNGNVFYETTIAFNNIQAIQNLTLDSPMKNGVYMSAHKQDGAGYYQLAFLPSQAVDLPVRRKTAVLVDFESGNSSISKGQLLEQLKLLLASEFSAQDSFALILSNLDIRRQSEYWLPADEATINQVFNGVSANDLANYSNLFSLLVDGIQFVKENGGSGNILLISNVNGQNNLEATNQRIDDLLELMDNPIAVNVMDYQNRNFIYQYFGGRSFTGNEYFYRNLAQLTNGYYSNGRYQNFAAAADDAFQALAGRIRAFDLHTSAKDGFCYARQDLSSTQNLAFLTKAVRQVGKFQGSLPIKLEVVGDYQGQIFSQQYELAESDLPVSDITTRQIWAGSYLQQLERSNQDNETINEILATSLTERVLSIYTAFLCLDPSQGGEICEECNGDFYVDDNGGGGGEVTVVDDVAANSQIELKAFPNPFREEVTFSMKLSEAVAVKELSFVVYDALGRVVKTFQPSDWKTMDEELQLSWNAEAEGLPTGLYYLVVTDGKERKVLKLLHM